MKKLYGKKAIHFLKEGEEYCLCGYWRREVKATFDIEKVTCTSCQHKLLSREPCTKCGEKTIDIFSKKLCRRCYWQEYTKKKVEDVDGAGTIV